MERTCGNCTACCKTHGILEFQKLAGEWCSHCDINVGCKIYSVRPIECKEFQCAWLMGVGESHHRPDVTKIVPDYREIPVIGTTMFFFELIEGSLSSDFVRRWTLRNIMVGNCVMYMPLNNNPRLFLSKKFEGTELPSFMSGEYQRKVETIPFSKLALMFGLYL